MFLNPHQLVMSKRAGKNTMSTDTATQVTGDMYANFHGMMTCNDQRVVMGRKNKSYSSTPLPGMKMTQTRCEIPVLCLELTCAMSSALVAK